MTKVALCFFGITRSLKFTIQSIEKRIFNVLDKNNIDYDIYLHTYNHNNYENSRTKEKFNDVDNEEYKLLNPKYQHIDNQDDIKKLLDLKKYRTHKDPWPMSENYNSVDNFILAQYSKLQLVNMIKKNSINYDYIIYLRPDVYYCNALNIVNFKKISNNNICIPNFHLYSKFNDRFAITNIKTYEIYGKIFNHLYGYSKKNKLHSETTISRILKRNKITWTHIEFKFARVRMDGSIADLDKRFFLNKISNDECKRYTENNKLYIKLE